MHLKALACSKLWSAGSAAGKKVDADAEPSGQQGKAGAGKGPSGLEAALQCEENLASDDAAASPGWLLPCSLLHLLVLSDYHKLNINRPYRDAQNKPAWQDRTWATST